MGTQRDQPGRHAAIRAKGEGRVVRLHRLPSLPGIELRQVRHLSSQITCVTELLILAMNTRGAFRYGCRGSTSLVPPGALAVVERGQVHTAAPVDGELGTDLLFIDRRALARLTSDDAGLVPIGFSLGDPVCTNRVLCRSFYALAAVLRDASTQNMLAEERVHALLEALGPVVGGRLLRKKDCSSDGEGVRRAREMIHDLYDQPLTLDALTERSGLPKPRFLSAFKRLVGVPPHAYQTQLRVEHARQLIARGTPISEASTAAGFFDQSHLHRHFVRCHGLTPGEYGRQRGGRGPLGG
jgi:AraC-like DNA-binding protein